MDVEKTIEFILEQQARLDAEFNAKLDTHKTRFEEEMTRINNTLLELAAAQERTNAILATLVEKHVELADSHKALADRTNELAEAQKVTEQNLNTLISVVEHHITDHKH